VAKGGRSLYVVHDQIARGAQGIILACMELQLVLKPGDVDASLFDTVAFHVEGAAE
jgi:aspartate racemase